MTQTARPRRSVLYMPGSNARALEKARTLPADALILDLEDAVAPDAKIMARDQVCDAVRQGGYGGREIAIRINGLDPVWGADDLTSALQARPDAVLVPKVSTADDIERLDAAMAGADPSTALWAMMETPLAMLNAGEIAACALEGSRLSLFVMGTNDLAKDTGAQIVPGRAPMLPWLQTCLAAARAHGLAIIDGVFNRLDDADGFEAECLQGRQLGMDGKTLIHPKQIEPANTVFAPTSDEIAHARAVLDAFARSENAAKGAIMLNGRMVERLHADMAGRVVAMSDAIAAMEHQP